MPVSSTMRKRAAPARAPSPIRSASTAASLAISARLSLPSWNSAAWTRGALGIGTEIAALGLERADRLGVDRIDHHQRVLGGAGGRVVEGLGARDPGRSSGEIGALVDDHRHVAGADPDRRRAARVGLADVGLAAGADDQVDRAHQEPGPCPVDRLRQHLDQVRRQADLGEPGAHVVDRPGGGPPAGGRGRDDDRVAALERHHRLVDRRCRGVGRRRDRADHAHGLGVLDDPARNVLLDHADRPDPQEVAQRAEGLALVFPDFVVDVAEAGVGDRELGQLARVLGPVERPGERAHGIVDQPLIGAGEARQGSARAGDQFAHDRPAVGFERRCGGCSHVFQPSRGQLSACAAKRQPQRRAASVPPDRRDPPLRQRPAQDGHRPPGLIQRLQGGSDSIRRSSVSIAAGGWARAHRSVIICCRSCTALRGTKVGSRNHENTQGYSPANSIN